ncbi:MAG: DUF2007 domain-containing protein [Chitinophagales bacterium]|nr:DUF2007 domain-containing protein [Chitinophagales bacterium]HMW12551.1 DUF2007 domain-containing protein [Chitinophagales bacterium]HMX59815.1 DUF2007 domain-containing protein [Chitinophagales bacterium]HMY23207.1 DUF2007 domain-containing protein [Chitinophagales bacterium]HMZ33498.1 DUF2007 domain-containing protein [Chitinophagales bacterium]
MNDKLVKIATYFNQFDVDLAKFKLEENGIYCFIKNEHVAQLQFGLANFELMVFQKDKEAALIILEQPV